MRLSILPVLSALLVTSAATTILLPTSTASAPFDEGPSGTYVVDGAHSSILFRIKHLDVAWNYGRFNEFEGTFMVDEDPGKCSVSITLKTGSVDTGDKDRDGHIASGDFLGSEDFPEATFSSTKVTRAKDTFTVTGDFKLHGKTRTISFDMELTGHGDSRFGKKVGLLGEIELDRRDYGIETYPDEVLSDAVFLTLAIEANHAENDSPEADKD